MDTFLLIIAIIAAFASLVLNAYNYFGDRSLRHLYRATDYTSQSALNKATENRKLIDDLGGDFGARVAEIEAYINPPTAVALPEPNEADLKQEMDDSLDGVGVVDTTAGTGKKISKWLSEMPEPYRTQALNEFERQGWINMPSFSMVNALSAAFDWGDSPQGEDYWIAIYEHYNAESNDTWQPLPEPWTPPTVEDSVVLNGEELVLDANADDTAAAVENNAPDTTECAEPCGMNYCDENGCSNRKRVYVDAPNPETTEAAPEPADNPKRKSRRPIPPTDGK